MTVRESLVLQVLPLFLGGGVLFGVRRKKSPGYLLRGVGMRVMSWRHINSRYLSFARRVSSFLDRLTDTRTISEFLFMTEKKKIYLNFPGRMSTVSTGEDRDSAGAEQAQAAESWLFLWGDI